MKNIKPILFVCLFLWGMVMAGCSTEKATADPQNVPVVQGSATSSGVSDITPIAQTAVQEKSTKTKVLKICVVTGTGVRLRDMPSTNGKIIKQLAKGEEVQVISEEGQWAYIEVDGLKGYVFTEYVKEKGTKDETPVAVENKKSTGGKIIAIDAGHQKKGNNQQEPIGPGAKETKAKVSSGTAGVVTKVPEYQLNLDVSMKLKQALLDQGYQVVMIRETNDVDLSNRERAEAAAKAGADILVRIHANGSENQNDNGILTISPTKNNPYMSNLYAKSKGLSQDILDQVVSSTGAKSKGVWETDTMAGINWSTIPVTIVEMGFMSNPKEDRLMQTAEYQDKIVSGIVKGMDDYFANN